MKRSLGAKTVVYPAPVFMVGTYDGKGRPNVMAAAWAGICCSSPPCLSVSLRKATYTFDNIVERKAFTVSFPTEEYVREADYFGIASGRNEDKFTVSGLTPVPGDFVDAPYVGDFPVVLECRLLHSLELGLHTQFIGEILDVKMDEEVLGEGNLPDIRKIRPIALDPEGLGYYGIGPRLGGTFSIGRELQAGKR